MNGYDKTVKEIRNFNRFYSASMDFLNLDYLDTAYSLVESRILFEIKIHEKCIQKDIATNLNIDKSYLSRILKRFDKNGLVEKAKSDEDQRATYISLTEKGNEETEKLIELTNNQIKAKIDKLTFDECNELCNAINIVISLLGKEE